MMPANLSNCCRWLILLFLEWTMVAGCSVAAAELDKPIQEAAKPPLSQPLAAVLTPAAWKQVENAIDRALAWMASRQGSNGAFQTVDQGQPGVTSLCTLAFLSRGHTPGRGSNGDAVNRGIDFVLSCQMTNGLFSYQTPGPVHQNRRASHTAIYNHAISGLMLGEVYGQVSGPRGKAVRQAIERALRFSRQLQVRSKRPVDKGGWRYVPVYDSGVDSDLSVTGWQLMFLRSARNAEFDVPQGYVDEAVEYVRRLWDPASGAFCYQINVDPRVGPRITRGMTGAGILCLSMAGKHETVMARSAGDWLLAHPFRFFGQVVPGNDDRFFYSGCYCSQAMAQLGGHYWEKFFPVLVKVLLDSQAPDGSWPEEPGSGDYIFGNDYTTALAVLSLTPPYQLLPVYQR
jgi:hypothetical protein